MDIWDEGDFLFCLGVTFLVTVFTFSGGRTPVENAGLCSNVSSPQRPFLVTLDIPRLSSKTGVPVFTPISGMCSQPRAWRLRSGLRERLGQQRAPEDRAPGRGAGSERPARPGSLQLRPRGRPLPGGPDTTASKVSPRFSRPYGPGAAPRGAGLWPRGLVRSPLPPRGLRRFQEGGERGRGRFHPKGGDGLDPRKVLPPPSTSSRAQVPDRPRKMETRRPGDGVCAPAAPGLLTLEIGVIHSSIMGLYHRSLIHDTVDKHLGRSQILAIRSKGLVNILLSLLSLGLGSSAQ